MIKDATEEDSGDYTVKVENNKGSSSYTVSVNIGPKDEETVVQEVVTVHKVSEKAEVLEGTVGELDTSSTVEAKETLEANLKEQLEEAEKLIVVDNKISEEDDTDKKGKKKEVTVKKEVVTVHKVEEQVLEGGQVVREISETVSSSELESGSRCWAYRRFFTQVGTICNDGE